MQLIKGDCLEEMKLIPDGSIDMVLTDLPYGTTGCSWDEIIPLDQLWKEYKRITKDNSAIVLFGSQPFTSKLIASNFEMFRYGWVWDKVSVSNPQLAKKQPLKHHEDILVFSKKPHRYFPQGLTPCHREFDTKVSNTELLTHIRRKKYVQEFTNYPKSILRFPRPSKPIHPTQKPIELLEYLIKTYTLEGETVLDSTAGSGSTGIAALNTNRDFILIEQDEQYCDLINKRLKEYEDN